MGAGEEDLRSAGFAADIEDVGADAVAVAEHLARQHFVAADDGFTAAEIDDHAAIFDALDDAVDDVADAVLEFLILPVALGLAHLLHDHLLGGLRGDAAIFQRRQGVGDGVADLGARVGALRVRQRNLVRGVLDLLDDQHVARQPQLTLLGVDLGVNVGLAAVTGAGRLGDGVFHRSDHDPAVDRLFAGDRVCDLQQFEFVGTDGHGLVSFSRIEVAPAQSFCGEAVFLCIGRLRLLAGLVIRFVIRLGLRLVAPGRIALLCVRRRWRRQPEILLQFALGLLAAPHRFRNQFVGQNQPRVGDVFHHQQHIGIFARAYVIPM